MASLFTFGFVCKQAAESQSHPSGPVRTTKKLRGGRGPCLHRKDTHNFFCELCREFSALAMLGKRFFQIAWLHVIQAGVYREALEICRSSRMSTSISSQAGLGTRHLRGHAAGSGREAATVDLTRGSEESHDEEDNDVWDSSDRTMVTFSSFLPLLNLSRTCFLAFLQILYLYNMYIMSCIFH